MEKIGIGLIGCGGRLRGVLNQVMKAGDGLEVRAVCDPSDESVRTTREAFNPKASVYGDYRELVKDPAVDWVMIGSWNCYHAEQATAAFQAGKHVFCEKPLALTLDDCLDMRRAWQESGKMFSIGFTLRYSPHYRRMKEIIAAGTIGDIVSMEFNETLGFDHGGYIHRDWRRKTEWAGSHMLEKCCHDVDLVNWMVGSCAVKTASFGGLDFFRASNARFPAKIANSKEGKEAFKGWPVRGGVDSPFNDDKDIIDNQVVILEFANRVRASFHTNCSTAMPERRMYICGTDGTLRADVVAGRIELCRIGYDTEVQDLSSDGRGGHGGGDSILGESVAASMLRGEAPRTGLEDGLRSAVTVFGIDQALADGTVVDFTPLWERAGIAVC